MQKINNLFAKKDKKTDNQFDQLIVHANKHLDLQHFWRTIAPNAIGQSMSTASLTNGQFLNCAYNNSVAAKIKLTNASLLTQLQNLQKKDPHYKQYKVTGISVKVQVKSQEKRATIAPRTLSSGAAKTLRELATTLGNSPLAEKLNKIDNNN